MTVARHRKYQVALSLGMFLTYILSEQGYPLAGLVGLVFSLLWIWER